MRKVASYAFEIEESAGLASDSVRSRIDSAVNQWIKGKGAVELVESERKIVYRDGRAATLTLEEFDGKEGWLRDYRLSEETEGGVFLTSFAYAGAGCRSAFSCTLRAGGPEQPLQPFQLDVYCPRLVRDVIRLDVPWQHRGSIVADRATRFSGQSGGDDLATLIWSDSRQLPVIAVSEHDGLTIHPEIEEDIARDLAGLAIVAILDNEASWRLSRLKGKEWSCFLGSLRVYWPSVGHDPFGNQLWTSRRLLDGVPNTEAASTRIRRQLRRRILGLSTFTVWDPELIAGLRKASQDKELNALVAQAEHDEDWIGLAHTYSEQVDRLKKRLKQKDDDIRDLQTQIGNLQKALQWQPSEHDEVPPESVDEIETVEEAVARARESFGEDLVFGDDVDEGVQTLDPRAGPPNKVFKYLQGLAEMNRKRTKEPLGNTAVDWLKERGVDASRESQTILNSPREMEKRTFHDGNARRSFECHLKPSDAVSPDRCVRIYFDFDDARAKTIVGWVGRHP